MAHSNNFENFMLMLADMKEHVKTNGGNIMQEDNPSQLKIGYKCAKTDKKWLCRLVDIKRTVEALKMAGETDKAQIIINALTTNKGKEELLKNINSSQA